MYGFYNKMMKVDAGRRSFEVRELPDDLLSQTLGGRGLGTHLLLELNPPGVDPLGPGNNLIITTGPATGTAVWGSCRHAVFTKSPQTGLYSESYSGGKAAESISATGLDAIAIDGASEHPIWLEITPDEVVFHDASQLWGLDTYQTEDAVKKWIKENRPRANRPAALVIGPAGENLVSYAVIENEYWRSAGRTGSGAVMGSKRIKAIAFWGDRKREVADPALLKEFVSGLARRGKDDPGAHVFKTQGTPVMVDVLNNAQAFPSRYWQKGTVEHNTEINSAALHSRCEVTPHACLKCFLACGRMTTVKQGRHAGMKMEGPEYETIYAFGGLCEVDSIEEIIYLNDVCDRLGMDTISGGNMAAMTIEAVRQGKVSYDIDYGEADKIAGLLRDIAYVNGVGAVLAKGVKYASPELGMADQAVHVKGLEPAGYDPRVLRGMGLAYATAPRGACHLRATFYKADLANIIQPDQVEGVAEVFVEWEDRLGFFDNLVLCRFYRDLVQWKELGQILKAVIGLDLNTEQMRAISAEVTNNTRRFNLREGLTMADDRLPKRFTSQALPESQKVLDQAEMRRMLAEYYRARGWDSQGRPEPHQRNL